MNSMVSNAQQSIQPVNSAKVVGIFKAIAPRSFEKTFEGIPTEQINHAMKICLDGLTHEQVNIGLSMVRDNGFCPDPAMFRKWCLGITGFGTEQQRAVDSFKKKHAALADIIKWRVHNDSPITNAEKEAFDRCYQGFLNLDYATNFERASHNVYEAFKENYVEVVNEFVAKGICQEIWVKPAAIPVKTDWADFGEDKPVVQTEEEKQRAKEYLDKLKALIKRPAGLKEQGGAA
ncbi:hypothetical protein [Acinetobacter soli]|uniref:hypothetical protein n=1 Tax=Acinetobacter soli TaxID=487316 RepID=UPI000E6AB79F|nr:hypothetical protein [Acinetobacter soli]